ncbi:MAG: UDP-N-acetylmuramate--L-alanine ligase [Chitinophagaceae bacterium]|nr:UDP-N-acetylmuramate--L-alanine ligase [Chitinophagaceae bacterium]MCW5904830.1 UDP-N-acetylmuramate--L-alanine ligase [Chitinophagaceae bacterium]
MSELKNIQNIYFIGIGGIGMSALARYFKSQGCEVAGYDRTKTHLTQALEDAGINIHYTEDVNAIPKNVDVVVYTPAVPKEHKELLYYQANNYIVVKRSDVLQWITKNSFNICISGTHGKTTITTMTAHILKHSGYGCNAFLGGIAANYNTNFWAQDKNSSSHTNNVVVEADEYDRSFLKLTPDVAVITAMDADHLDIYGTPEELENTFIQFSKKLKPNGCLITKYGLKKENELNATHHYTYSFNNTSAYVYAANLKVENENYVFDIVAKNWTIKNITLHMGGLHNVENTIAATTVAKYLNIDDEKIKNAIADFKGVKRRFEYIIKNDATVLIDDYAHHPEELKALITGVKSIFTNKKTLVVFQPHLYSRTKDFANEFAESLDMADEVILLPIYPARELPINGVSSEMIISKMNLKHKQVLSKEDFKHWVKQHKPQLLVMAGAGDIDVLVQPVKEILQS